MSAPRICGSLHGLPSCLSDPTGRRCLHSLSGRRTRGAVFCKTRLPYSAAGPRATLVLTLEQDGSQILEHQIVARKGMTLYILTTDSLAGSTADCQSDFRFIQQHVVFPK